MRGQTGLAPLFRRHAAKVKAFCWASCTRFAGKYELPGVSTLGNMMGDVNHDNASEASHGLKLSEKIGCEAGWGCEISTGGLRTFPVGRKQWCQPRLSPFFPFFKIALEP
jgi:hypothetical protein